MAIIFADAVTVA